MRLCGYDPRFAILINMLMKKSVFSLLTACGLVFGAGVPDGYTLIMGDEFDQGVLNTDNWSKFDYNQNAPNINWAQFGSNDDAMYVFDNEAGTLNLKARYGDYTSQKDQTGANDTYAAGQIYSNLAFQYGYVEVRARMESAYGLWPAIWLYTTDGSKGGEIDMLEHLNYAGAYYTTTHGSYNTTCVSYNGTRAEWHTYGMLWEPGRITMYLDGNQVVSWTNTATHDKEGNLFRLRLTQQIAGSWVGYSAETMLNSEALQNQVNNNYDDDGNLIDSDGKDYEIDYVRIYQKTEQPVLLSLRGSSAVSVPEPASASLCLLALAALSGRRRRR